MNKLFIFIAGAGIGAGTAWYFTKKKYEKIADEEIESVKEHFERRKKDMQSTIDLYRSSVENHIEGKTFEDLAKEKEMKKVVSIEKKGPAFEPGEDTDDKEEEAELTTNKNIIDNLNYATGVDTGEGEDYTVPATIGKDGVAPFVITEDEYGELDYEEKTLLYYRDSVLADDEDIMVDDPFTTVGDALDQFDRDPYLERLYVRDEENEIDYTILKSEKNYTDLIKEDK